MKFNSTSFASVRRAAAFTMVEIAIALGVIGFALVAIIGILPTGLEVQRDNRSETIINQDATYWLEAIRSGAQGIDDLTNWVESVSLPENPGSFEFGPAGLGGAQYANGGDIVSLLTTAIRFGETNSAQPTVVHAIVTAFSGSAVEKDHDRNNRELSFKYRLSIEITNATWLAQPFAALDPQNNPPNQELDSLYEVRLTFHYPYVSSKPGEPRRKLYRATVSRNVLTNTVNGREYYLFTP